MGARGGTPPSLFLTLVFHLPGEGAALSAKKEVWFGFGFWSCLAFLTPAFFTIKYNKSWGGTLWSSQQKSPRAVWPPTWGSQREEAPDRVSTLETCPFAHLASRGRAVRREAAWAGRQGEVELEPGSWHPEWESPLPHAQNAAASCHLHVRSILGWSVPSETRQWSYLPIRSNRNPQFFRCFRRAPQRSPGVPILVTCPTPLGLSPLGCLLCTPLLSQNWTRCPRCHMTGRDRGLDPALCEYQQGLGRLLYKLPQTIGSGFQPVVT